MNVKSNTSGLSPCPFCKINSGVVVETGHTGCSLTFAVECTSCGALGPEAQCSDTGTYEQKEMAQKEASRLWDNQATEKNRIESAWLAAAKDLSSEIYDGRLNLLEVPTDTFSVWYQWRLATKPNTETGIPIKDFDIESAMMFFEDDVKAANVKISEVAGRKE